MLKQPQTVSELPKGLPQSSRPQVLSAETVRIRIPFGLGNGSGYEFTAAWIQQMLHSPGTWMRHQMSAVLLEKPCHLISSAQNCTTQKGQAVFYLIKVDIVDLDAKLDEAFSILHLLVADRVL